MPLTVGTAGHIDHGKTWLVRALTGKDTDRLPEEQPARDLDRPRLRAARAPRRTSAARSSTSPATSASCARWSPVRPGSTSSSSSSTRARGLAPQTHEHLAILRLLGVERGVVAVTKADAVDADTLELALEEARELVPGAEVVRREREGRATGLDELRAALGRAADGVEPPTRPIVRRACTWTARSRCAGSAPSSRARSGRARSEPGTSCGSSRPDRSVRVRSVQVHDREVERAEPGQRVARQPPRRRAARGRARRRARRAGGVPGLVPSGRRARRARADRRRRDAARAPRNDAHRCARRPAREALRAAPTRARPSSPRAATG